MNQVNINYFKQFKNIAFTFLGIFVLLLILLHFLDPQVGFATGFVSNFALGNFNLVFIICLTCLSISKYFLYKLVRLTSQNIDQTKWLQFFILFSATTNFLIGFFPTQYGPNINIVGYLHLVFAYFSFTSTAVFLTLFTFEKSSSNQSKIFKVIVAVVYNFCLIAYPFSANFAPIAERILIFMVVLGIFTNLVLIQDKSLT
jgi:hypothetical protein